MNTRGKVTITISGPICSGRSTLAFMIKNLLDTFGIETEYIDQDSCVPFTPEQIARNLNDLSSGTNGDPLSVKIETITTIRKSLDGNEA